MHTLDDYRNAPSGTGPLADEWRDKPHRLIYDLCSALENMRESICEARRLLNGFDHPPTEQRDQQRKPGHVIAAMADEVDRVDDILEHAEDLDCRGPLRDGNGEPIKLALCIFGAPYAAAGNSIGDARTVNAARRVAAEHLRQGQHVSGYDRSGREVTRFTLVDGECTEINV